MKNFKSLRFHRNAGRFNVQKLITLWLCVYDSIISAVILKLELLLIINHNNFVHGRHFGSSVALGDDAIAPTTRSSRGSATGAKISVLRCLPNSHLWLARCTPSSSAWRLVNGPGATISTSCIKFAKLLVDFEAILVTTHGLNCKRSPSPRSRSVTRWRALLNTPADIVLERRNSMSICPGAGAGVASSNSYGNAESGVDGARNESDSSVRHVSHVPWQIKINS